MKTLAPAEVGRIAKVVLDQVGMVVVGKRDSLELVLAGTAFQGVLAVTAQQRHRHPLGAPALVHVTILPRGAGQAKPGHRSVVSFDVDRDRVRDPRAQ